MVRHVLFALALAGTPTVASACECDDPAQLSVEEQEERASWIAGRDFMVAEVVRLDRNDGSMPIRYKVIRPLIGKPPSEIIFSLNPAGPFTSCDYWGTPGKREIMAFGSSPLVSAPPCGLFSRINQTGLYPAGMCTQYAVQAPGMVERIRRARSRSIRR